jgi:hypothetical protein
VAVEQGVRPARAQRERDVAREQHVACVAWAEQAVRQQPLHRVPGRGPYGGQQADRRAPRERVEDLTGTGGSIGEDVVQNERSGRRRGAPGRPAGRRGSSGDGPCGREPRRVRSEQLGEAGCGEKAAARGGAGGGLVVQPHEKEADRTVERGVDELAVGVGADCDGLRDAVGRDRGRVVVQRDHRLDDLQHDRVHAAERALEARPAGGPRRERGQRRG